MVENILNRLECFNDTNFTFDADAHVYKYNKTQLTSVTNYIEQFHEPFDSKFWSEKKSSQTGERVESILERWDIENQYSKKIGTNTHIWIENHYNKIWQEIPTDYDLINRINKFNIIYASHLHKLMPIKFEQRIFSKKYKLAGTVDGLFLYNDAIFILDWKTNKNFTSENNPPKYETKLKPPFQDYDKTHHIEYSIQISLYSIILKEWGFDIKGGYLVHIPPMETPATIYKTYDFVDILSKHLENDTYIYI
jgi:ATP-dependent exoDNAse (exonuclease V) beta subunit